MCKTLASRWAIAALTAFAVLVCLSLNATAARADATFTIHTTTDTISNGCTPTSGICSLREALDLTNAGAVSGAVTIELAVEGTIDTWNHGPLEIEPHSSVSSLRITGPGSSELSLNGGQEARIFNVESGQVTISGLTLTEGWAESDGGGAIYQDDGNLVLEQMVLTDNSSKDGLNGGAIYQDDGNLLIVDSLLSDNLTAEGFAGGDGAAIYEDTSSTGTLTLEATEVTGNKAEGDGGGIFEDEGQLTVTRGSRIVGNEAGSVGGGIYAEGSGSQARVLITGASEVSENKAERAGGVFGIVGGRGLVVATASIVGNTATDVGGGIYAADDLTVEDSLVAQNSSEANDEEGGGGIFADSAGEALVETSTIAGNSGTGIYNHHSELVVRNSTIVANSGAGLPGAGVVGSATLTSTILSGNHNGSGEANCFGEIESGGHNLVGVTGSECSWEESSGDQLETDPLLGPLADNGGPTLTMAPVSRQSPAINRGSQPGPGDQRGFARPVPVGELFTDVGAVEVQAPKSEAAPSITPADNLKAADSVTCGSGTWNTDTVTEPLVTYEWLRGATKVGESSTYTLSAADADQSLTCKVTVNNGVTPAAATSAAVELEPGHADLSPATLSFGPRNLGAGPSAPLTFTLTNTGGTDLTVANVVSDDQNEFAVDTADCLGGGGVLVPGASCAVPVSFDPGTTGPRSAQVEVQSDGGDPVADATGSGTLPVLEVLPPSFDFGPRELGTGASPAKAFKVLNTGSGPAAIEPLAFGGPNPADFSLVPGGDDCGGETIEPGQLCVVEVRFEPQAVGLREATLELKGEASANLSLQGTGTVPPSPNPPTPPTPPGPEPEPPAPTLTVQKVVHSGEAVLVTLVCRSFQPRCEGQLQLRTATGRRVELAGGTVSIPNGKRKARLSLTYACHVLLESEPSPLLKVKATAFDRTYDRETVRVKRLRLR